MLAAASTLPQRRRRSMEIQYGSALRKPFTVGRTKNRSAARREDDIGQRDEIAEHRFLAIAKPGFTLQLENQRNRDPESALQLGIRIIERLVQPFGEQP